ncbi:hypothetical protein [Kitasatospora sp. NPDC088346]|uniref:hypothetical protein n=1 Tax=Kitasatospora sp. NPDC088346 TaxID=3364073 RepID=UPI003820D6D8
MIFLGLVLLALSGTFTGLLIADNLDNGPTTQISVLGSDIGSYTVPKAFLAGAALMLIFLTGVAMVWRGAARARHRKVELQAARLAAAGAAPTPAPAPVPTLVPAAVPAPTPWADSTDTTGSSDSRPDPAPAGLAGGATALTARKRAGAPHETDPRTRHWWQRAG